MKSSFYAATASSRPVALVLRVSIAYAAPQKQNILMLLTLSQNLFYCLLTWLNLMFYSYEYSFVLIEMTVTSSVKKQLVLELKLFFLAFC